MAGDINIPFGDSIYVGGFKTPNSWRLRAVEQGFAIEQNVDGVYVQRALLNMGLLVGNSKALVTGHNYQDGSIIMDGVKSMTVFFPRPFQITPRLTYNFVENPPPQSNPYSVKVTVQSFTIRFAVKVIDCVIDWMAFERELA